VICNRFSLVKFNCTPSLSISNGILLLFFWKKNTCYFCNVWVLWLNKCINSIYQRNRCYPAVKTIKLKLSFF
jgi:hypothetical protein